MLTIVKAGCGKSARPVWEADGGQRRKVRLLRPDSEKLANKPGQPGAESAEPREGTEGNTGEQHTCRTQSRESVSQGLERVREVAKQDKKERFTSLLHHVTIDLLKDAYSWLKREAAPGVDGRTWQSYKENLEVNLSGTAWAHPPRHLSSASITATVHPKTRRAATPAGDRRTGR